jgi:hypothetical protein
MKPAHACLALAFALLQGGSGAAETRLVSGFDSGALRAALVQAQPGDTVQLPAGLFTITESIRPRSGLRLLGAGQDQTIVHFAGAKPGVMLNLADCEDVEVAQLTLDAQNNTNVSDNDGCGIQFGGAGLDGFSFLRCAVRGNHGPAMIGLRNYSVLEWTGCLVADNKTNAIRPPKPFPLPAPVAAFELPGVARVGTAVRFASAYQPAAVLWDFGDGAPASGPDTTHSYTRPGAYRVTLIVWDEHGRGARDEKVLRVTP